MRREASAAPAAPPPASPPAEERSASAARRSCALSIDVEIVLESARALCPALLPQAQGR
jgi:hypothetical protein